MPTLTTNLSIVRGVACLSLATALLAVAGCDRSGTGTPAADHPDLRPSELSDADGRPCPKQLPMGEDSSVHGFGTEEVADELPTLLQPKGAWVCQYDTFDAGTTTGGGFVFGWRRVGEPQRIAAADLAGLQRALDNLALADPSGACTDDLGSRWMVVSSHDGDLTGVVVDDYGCREVRLTDDPHATPPGADDQDGTVGGVLAGGTAILDVLGVGRSS